MKGIILDGKDWGTFLLPRRKLFSGKSKFQKIEVYEHDFFGRVLVLDGGFQTSELDEFLFHESLVQYPLFAHPNPKKVLIIGGGDGGSLEEAAKHKELKKIVMVELDESVVEVSKKFLGKIHRSAFSDGRVELLYMDGIDYVVGCDEKFDVVILDLTATVGEATKLFTREFYESIRNVLNENGIVSLHPAYYFSDPEEFGRIAYTLRSVFKHVSPHGTDVPLYGGTMYFLLCSADVNFEKLTLPGLEKRFDERKIPDLRYYTPSLFASSLKLPKYVEDTLSKKYEIITLKNQISE